MFINLSGVDSALWCTHITLCSPSNSSVTFNKIILWWYQSRSALSLLHDPSPNIHALWQPRPGWMNDPWRIRLLFSVNLLPSRKWVHATHLGKRWESWTQKCLGKRISGGFNPSEKHEPKWESSPHRGENKKCLKPPPRYVSSQDRTCWFLKHFHLRSQLAERSLASSTEPTATNSATIDHPAKWPLRV